MEENSTDWGDVINSIYENKRNLKENIVKPNLGEKDEGFSENQKYIMYLVRKMDLVYSNLINNTFNTADEAKDALEIYHNLKAKLHMYLPE